MRKGDIQLGIPDALYKGSKAAIEALTGVPEGAVAYATDTKEFGSYDGATWTWGQGSAVVEDTIVNGVTTKAPSQNAVFDALALKLNASQLEDAVNNGETTKAPTENAVYDALAAVVASTQPLDADLTAIAGLSPANDDILQRKAGAWTFRSVAQYILDLGLGSLAFLSSLAHSSLSGVGANDHHNQSHNHSASGDGQSLAPAGTLALTGDITPTSLSGNVNDYDPTDWSTAVIIRLSTNGAARTITGLAGGTDGRIAVLLNIDTTFYITLANESASSSAANRFSIGSNFPIPPNRGALLIYDFTTARWRMMLIHEHANLIGTGAFSHASLDAHLTDTANPHSTTLSQVGAFSDGEGDPADPGSAAADGTSAFAARRNHVHKGPKNAIVYFPTHCLTNSVNAASTWFMCPFIDGAPSATERAMVVLRAGVIKNLYVRQVGNQPGTGSLVITVRKNTTTDTTLTVTIAAGAAGPATVSDTTHAPTVAAGDFLGIKLVNNAPAAPSATLGFIAFEIEYDP